MKYLINDKVVQRKAVQRILDEPSLKFVEERFKVAEKNGINHLTTKISDEIDISIIS